MKFAFSLFALVLGCASAQTPAPVDVASSFPSGSTFPSSTPSDSPSALETPSPLPPTATSGFEFIETSPTHETLTAAIMLLNAQGILTETPNLSIFAPTDGAFGALFAETGRLAVDIFSVPFRKHLECFILSHVVGGIQTSNVLAQKPITLTTLSGFEAEVTQSGGEVLIAGAQIDMADLPAANGVVHVLNTRPIVPPCVGQSIAEQAAVTPNLSTFIENVATVSLVNLISNLSPLTALIPTNEAWERIPSNVKNFLNTNATALEEVLKYHIFLGVNFFNNIEAPTNFTTPASGSILTVSRVDGAFVVEGQQSIGTSLNVKFLSVDNLAQNGLYHTIDEVLIPPSLILPTIIFCFPGDATVDVKDAGKTLMKDLKIGDDVMTSSGTYDKVYSFGHYQPDVVGEYLKISTKETARPLQLSKDHMVFVDSDKSVPASSLKVGDQILLDTGKQATITKVSTTYSNGAYAPFTESGSIVVDGVVASSYIAMDEKHSMLTLGDIELPISYQWMSHAAQAPHRLYCRLFECDNETYSDEGISMWVAGPFRAGKFMLAQGLLAQMLAFLVLVPFFALCAALELVATSPVSVVTGAVGMYSVSNMYKLRVGSAKVN